MIAEKVFNGKRYADNPHVLPLQCRGCTSWIVLCAVWFACCACGATEYFVDKNRPDDSGAGTSVATAFKTIQAAVAKAGTGDVVTVLPGEYAETPVTVADGSYSSKSRLHITKRITLRSRYGAAKTHIVGAHDLESGFDGMGPNAVRWH